MKIGGAHEVVPAIGPANDDGRAHVTQRKYTNQYGEEKTINDIGRFIDYDPKFFDGGTQVSGSNLPEINEDDLPFKRS